MSGWQVGLTIRPDLVLEWETALELVEEHGFWVFGFWRILGFKQEEEGEEFRYEGSWWEGRGWLVEGGEAVVGKELGFGLVLTPV